MIEKYRFFFSFFFKRIYFGRVRIRNGDVTRKVSILFRFSGFRPFVQHRPVPGVQGRSGGEGAGQYNGWAVSLSLSVRGDLHTLWDG